MASKRELEKRIVKLEGATVMLQSVIDNERRGEFRRWTDWDIERGQQGKLTLSAKINALAEHLGVSFKVKEAEERKVVVEGKAKPLVADGGNYTWHNTFATPVQPKRKYKKSKQQLAKEQSLRMKKYWAKRKEENK